MTRCHPGGMSNCEAGTDPVAIDVVSIVNCAAWTIPAGIASGAAAA